MIWVIRFWCIKKRVFKHTLSLRIMAQWKKAVLQRYNYYLGDPSIVHWTMIMGGRVPQPTSMKQIHPVAPFKRRNPRRFYQVHVHDPAVPCHAVLRVTLVALVPRRVERKLHSSSWSVPFAKISRWSFMNVQSQSAPPGWKSRLLVWNWGW